MRRNCITLFFLAVAVLSETNLLAQKTFSISVKQAVDLAFENVVSLKNAKLDYKIADARNKEITGLALPQVSSVVQGNHYLSLPLIQMPDITEAAVYRVLGREGVRNGAGIPVNPDDAEFKVNSFSFLAPWNVNGGIGIQQLLFEPQVSVGLQARTALLESSSISIKIEEDKIREAVYKSYYSVLIAQKQLNYLTESRMRLEKLAADMGVLFKNGFVEKLDIDKTTVSLNNIRTTENQIKNGIKIGYAVLKQTLGLTQIDSLVLTDVLSTELIKDGVLEENFSYENRNEIKFLNKAVELQGLDVRRYRLSYGPTIAAFYNFQRTGQRNERYQTITGKPWFWYNTGLAGVSISIPIFDGLQKKYKIKQAQYTQEKTLNLLTAVKNGIDLEKIVAKNTVLNSILAMDVQEKNMQLAEKVYHTVKKKYEQGIGSSFEVLQADTEMQQAQSNYFKAMYDAIIAKVNYLKAQGQLN